MGGSGDPAEAPEAEQDRLAAALLAARGHLALAELRLTTRLGQGFPSVRGRGWGAAAPALHFQRSCSGASRIRSVRAGAPATTALSGTSFVTTVFVPTMQLSPTVTPRRMQAP